MTMPPPGPERDAAIAKAIDAWPVLPGYALPVTPDPYRPSTESDSCRHLIAEMVARGFDLDEPPDRSRYAAMFTHADAEAGTPPAQYGYAPGELPASRAEAVSGAALLALRRLHDG